MLEARPGIVARAVQALRYTISGVGPGTWMGPLQPLAPMAPPETAGRQFDYPVGYNLSFVPRSTEPVGFVKLRLLADRCDLLRLVIERQKDLLESLDWSVKPREVRPGERPAEGGFQDRIAEIRRFFECPDGVHDWAQWLRMVLEDLAVIDAVSLYRRRDRLGRLAALEPLDGATIKVLLDASGRRPMAPDPAYQQILKGIPAVDYSADELLYYPRNPRTNHAYGYSPVEQIIRLAETAIERLGSQRAYFTHGNVSDGIFTGPAGWQTDQIKAWQGYWDALFAGNVEQRRAGWWVPAGTQYQALKQPALKDEFDEWLARLICFAFSTSPTPFVKAQNRATAETQQQTAEEGGLAPIMAYVKRLVDRVIATDLGCPDLEFVWSEDREFDPLTAARIDDLALRNGSRTVNEVRDRLGLDTLPGGDQPMVLTPTGYVSLTPAAPQKLGKADFVEDEHPRQPAGSPDGTGGQFAPKDSNSDDAKLEDADFHPGKFSDHRHVYMDKHFAQAQQIAAKNGNTVGAILGLSGFERGWGDGDFVKDGQNNFFSLHAPAYGESGETTFTWTDHHGVTHIDRMALFKDFATAAAAWMHDYGYIVKGITDPRAFATALQKSKKFGVDRYGNPVPGYIDDVTDSIEQAQLYIKRSTY